MYVLYINIPPKYIRMYICIPYLLELWPRSTIIFLPKNKDKTIQIVRAALWHYSRVHYYKILHSCAYYYILNITFLLMINDNSYNSFSCLQLCNMWGLYIQGIWTLDIGGHLELWVKDGDNHDTFVVVVIMTEHMWLA